MEILPNDPTLPEASAMLAQMEAAEAADSGQPASAPNPEPKPASATPAQRAEQPEAEPVPSTTPKPDGTPATEVPPKPEPELSDAEKSELTKAKAEARFDKSWKKHNAEKQALQKERDSFKAEREQLIKERHDLEAERQKLSQPKYKPDDYDTAATNWRKEAEQLESEGKFDEADEKRAMAKKANAYAEDLRKNPPPAPKTDQAKLDEYKAQQKEWWGKAAVDFPNVAKKDSPEAIALAELVKAEPAIHNDPKMMYFAARMVSAETSAARVPKMEKELVELRAKVKEFGEKLGDPGEGAATTISRPKADSEKSDDELEAELKREAEGRDASAGFR